MFNIKFFSSKIDYSPIYVLVQAVIVGNQLIESLLLQPSMYIKVLEAWLKEEMDTIHSIVKALHKKDAPGWAADREG